MELEITARHFNLTDSLKSYIEDNLSKVEKYSKRLINTRVILSVEKHRHTVEIIATAKNKNTFNIKEESDDMYGAIDSAIARLDKSLKRHKEKIKQHKTKKDKDVVYQKLNVVEPPKKQKTTKTVKKVQEDENVPIYS